MIQRARSESATSLDAPVRSSLEGHLGRDFGDVRVHAGSASQAAAEGLDARAFTIGSDIFLGTESRAASSAQRRELLVHEGIHAAQQGMRRVPLDMSLRVSQPSDSAEGSARALATSLTGEGSSALRLRDSLRGKPLEGVPPTIQRDIKGKGRIPTGDFEIDFTSRSGAVRAGEDGTVKFTPGTNSPRSSHIRFIQIVRVRNAAGSAVKFGSVNKSIATMDLMSTTANAKANVAGGFAVDQQTFPTPRKHKADAAVEPFYDVTGPPIAGNATGVHQGNTRTPAVLEDHPTLSAGRKVNFVSSVKGADNGIFYGAALWGFETFNDKGTVKVKNEYHSFRLAEGETMHAALQAFDEYYHNPGSSKAPKK